MLATNPKNGKQIKVMKSDASIWKDSKTLVWMKDPFSNKKWKRWDILVTSVNEALLKWNPDIVLLLEESKESNTWLKTSNAKNVRYIIVSLKAIQTLTSEGFDVSSLGNVLCIDEFESMYPFLGAGWDGSLEDAIACLTIVFRYNRFIGLDPKCVKSRLENLRFKDLKLQIFKEYKEPESLVLIQQYYKPAEKIREEELYQCLSMNIACEFVDEILLFVESKNLVLPPDPEKKIRQVFLKSRISYSNCIEAIQKLGPGKLVAFANTDIYLTDSWRSIWSVNLHDTLVALLRWEDEDTIFGPRNDSQDTWLIHSDSVIDRKWNLSAFNIPFGQSGCDNAILIEFLRNKFKIVNPAMNLKTIHVHKSEIRNYEKSNIVDRPNYMFVEPTGIHELNPVTSWSGWAGDPILYDPLDRPIKATTAKHLNMFCSQINRNPSFIWSADGLNTYLPPQGQDRPIDIRGGGFVSPSGLVYRHTDIYVGTTDIQKAAWSDNHLSHLMASYNVESMMAFHLENSWFNESALFTLYYLSKVIQQNKINPEASFWCKKTNDLLAAIQLFKWEKAQGRLLEYSDQTQVFAQRIVGRSCHGTRPVKADIDALREAMNGKWRSNPSGYTVIVEDPLHLKDDLIEILSKKFENIRVISCNANATLWAHTLSGASRVILSSSLKNIKINSWAWMWLAPVGCKVLELQEEREPSDSLLHLCAASGQDWTLLQYPRSTADGFKKIIEKEVSKWLVVGATTAPGIVVGATTMPGIVIEATMPDLPIIHTPPRSMKHGFFGHRGDAFREMIDLWVEAGYVQRKEDPALTMCWLNGPGEILLYDRPTWDWLDRASNTEKSYKLCLTGNPGCSAINSKPWIFWPREPRLIEEMSKVQRPYHERTESMVFYGRIENDRQGAWRKEDWSSACSSYVMQKGLEPYALNPREYLEALSKSRFGLCLRGFGPKCNREIELLAMGTVPVVSADVDIKEYMEPLIHGVHVIKVSDPKDAVNKIGKITEAQWNSMSKAGFQWWQRNCSAQGSWERTSAVRV